MGRGGPGSSRAAASPPDGEAGDRSGGGLLLPSIAVLGARALGGASAFVLNVLLARILGIEGVGVYFLATTVAGFAIILGRAGQENAILRFAAIASNAENWERLWGLRKASRHLVLAASLGMGVLLFVLAPLLASHGFDEPALTSLIRVLAVGIPLSALATIDIEVVRATGRVRMAAVLESLASPGLSLVMVVPLAVAFGVGGAVAGTVATSAAVLLVVWVALRRMVPRIERRIESVDRDALLKAGLPLLWIGLSAMILRMTDTVMLGILSDARAVGLYGAAVQIAGLASMVLAAVTGVVTPRFAALYHLGRIDDLGSLVRRATGWTIVLAAPILVLSFSVPGALLSIFGTEFVAGGAVVVILAAGHGVNVVSGPVGALLMMSGHERLLRNNVLFSGLVNIVLNVILVPAMAATGAAIATAISLALLNLLSAVQAHRRIGIGPLGRRRERRA